MLGFEPIEVADDADASADLLADSESALAIYARHVPHGIVPALGFRVEVDGGLEVLARAAGKMRRGRPIRILPGDRVDLELSAYDPTRGRIVWRYK